MPRTKISAIAAALALVASGAVAQTEQGAATAPGAMMGGADMPMMRQGPGGGMMQRHAMMRGDYGRGGMGPHMMLMMMALIDTDASGSLSLDEVQAVHARMFQYADTDDDGELTVEELRAFMHGEAMPAGR